MVTAYIDFATTDPDGFIEGLATTERLFVDVAGFNGFKVQRGVEDPTRFLVRAEWNSVDDHLAWQKSNVEPFLAALNPYLSGAPTITHYV